jgi:cysteine desulfurase/selenocysteine lyase
LIYLDNAATAQKPQAVIDAVRTFYEAHNANVHRGVHYLSERATDLYETARERVQAFLGATRASEIVFTRGTTESINLVAQTYGRQHVGPGDEILVSALEHHSNLVPWQMLCEEKGARLCVIPIDDAGDLDLDAYEALLSSRTRLVAITHVSNALGTVNPIGHVVRVAHAAGVPVLVDGAQSAGHMPVGVAALGCDFYACSGHKMFGPTGIGVLYGRAELLDAMPPWQGGGDMIRSVTFERTEYADPPARFEAGTPHIAGAVGLTAALEYIERIGRDRITARERELLAYATRVVESIPGVRIVGAAREKACILSFVVEGVHPHDVGQVLDGAGIAVRAGHHCAQPLMDRLGLTATVRASLAFYNMEDELDALGRQIEAVRRMFLE